MVSHGHRWLDVKQYSLGEIGVFLNSCKKEDEAKQTNEMSNAWLANHASQKFMKKYLKQNSQGQPPKKASKKEVEQGWAALTRMNGDFK